MVDFLMKYGEKEIESATIEVWDNPSQVRDYEIEINFNEFTCLCPRSGYPDFATIKIRYTPHKKIVELKSLKLYLNSFRSAHISHEAALMRLLACLYVARICTFPQFLKRFPPASAFLGRIAQKLTPNNVLGVARTFCIPYVGQNNAPWPLDS